ncbi:MAG: hypothetical protein EXQ70_05240 [Solirubrobacterales bacterium]|nr:hypothetical protein [Solirubrobacterales bacterium]
MAANHSERHRLSGLFAEAARDLRGLRGPERLAAVGVAVIVGSLLLPWYGAPGSADLVLTGLSAFGWAEGALVLAAIATLFLAMQLGGGYSPPRPLAEWGLLSAGGCWAALIVGFRMIYRPEFVLSGIPYPDDPYRLRYGIFVALGGALAIVIAGMMSRGVGRRADAAP